MADGDSFDFETPRLREVLERIRGISPAIARNLRRELRASGDEIISRQRAELRQRPPRVAGAKRRLVLIRPKKRKPYYAFRTFYQPGDPREGGVSQLRAKISAGLRTRVVTGTKREGIEIRTGGPRNGGYNMARIYQAKTFRHPVFGDKSRYAAQFGKPYFFGPITDELRGRMQQRIIRAVDDALDQLSTR